MEKNQEIVTGIRLVGDDRELGQKIQDVLAKDFEFFVSGDEKPFSNRILSDAGKISEEADHTFASEDGVLTAWRNDAAKEAYVEDGLVFPEKAPAVRFPVKVDKSAYLEGNQAMVQVQTQGKVPGAFYVIVEAKLEGGEDVSSEHAVFLDGKKMAQALGVDYKVVERGELDKEGNFFAKESVLRPEAIQQQEIVQEQEPKKERKSVMEQNMEAGFPDRINDMGTGFNRVYMKTFNGDFNKLKHADLFPKDVNAACPILADARVNLGDMTLMAVTVTPAGRNKYKAEMSYMPAVMELNLARYENDYTAYGPALARNVEPGHEKDGTTYYMDVTGMNPKALFALEDAIDKTVAEYNASPSKSKDVADFILKETMEHGAKSPVLALGREFDSVVREYEAQEVKRAQEEQERKAQAEKELEERNAAIKEEVKAKKKAGEYIRPETRQQIFVHKPVLVIQPNGERSVVRLMEPPDKEKGEDYFKVKVKVGYRDVEVRIPAASKELGIDGKPLSYVKAVRNQFSPVGHVINVSPKLGQQFPAYCNGMPTGTSLGFNEIYGYMEIKNQELRSLEQERREGKAIRAVVLNTENLRDSSAKANSLKPPVQRGTKAKENKKKSPADGNSGSSDGRA